MKTKDPISRAFRQDFPEFVDRAKVGTSWLRTSRSPTTSAACRTA